MSFYLVGDIGGTNARLELIEIVGIKNGKFQENVVAEKKFPSRKFSHLNDIIKKFLHESKVDHHSELWPRVACFAVAGPVHNGVSIITNLNWRLDGRDMSRELKIGHVEIINDFVGIGYGLLALDEKEKIVLNEGKPIAGAPKACLGAGTGLGEVYLTYNGKEYDVWPTEGGHADFAPRNLIEYELLEYIRQVESIERVSVERVVSGSALPFVFQYFCRKYPSLAHEKSIRAISESTDPGFEISKRANPKDPNYDEICYKSLSLFVETYGAEAGNLALKTLPYGGLYIAGGIALKIIWCLQENDRFFSNFINKGRMKSVLQNVPIYVVDHPNVGLLGARVVCRRLLKSSISKVDTTTKSKL